MRLVLMRHAETDLNTQNRFQARVDVPLNGRGVRQARAVAGSLRPGEWLAVYSSTSMRASRTAALVAESIGTSRFELGELCERDLGQLDGLDKAAHRATHPLEAERLVNDADYAPPDGESLRTALGRFCRGLARIVGDHRPGTQRCVLVVTHGGVLNALALHLRGGGAGPSGLVEHCRAVPLLVEVSGGALVARATRWNVEPRECEGAWPEAGDDGGPLRAELPVPRPVIAEIAPRHIEREVSYS